MANEIETVDQTTGEVMTMTEAPVALSVQLAQAELNQAVTTAKAFPRDMRRVQQQITALATLDDETAAESVYALPRGGKPIKGPSIRFAEIVASQYGNCHTGSRIVAVDKFDKVVVAEGIFFDLETGMKRTAQIRRRISDKHGRLFNDDMITVTGNAAASIAMREAILKGIPKALWRGAYAHCEKVIAGEVATLNVRREKAVGAFAIWGIKPEQIFSALEVENVDGVGLDELATLTAMHKAIKSGEQKLEDYFPAHSNGEKAVEAAKGTAAKLGQIAEQGKPKQADEAKGNTGTETQQKGTADAKGSAKQEEEAKDQGQSQETGDQGKQDDASDGSDVSADAEAAASQEEAAGPQINDDALEAAFNRGAEAKRKGMARKAAPPEWRAEGYEPLMDAWVRGWTETEAG